MNPSGDPAGLETERQQQVRDNFFSLTPDAVLAAVEAAGHVTTGLCYALNSLENRVYEVECEEAGRLIVKFYRPGRWSRPTIEDEHRLLAALQEAEIPVCAPQPLPGGHTLGSTAEGIYFAVFPKTGGRSPDELRGDDFVQLGRLLGRIHNVTASLGLKQRPHISPHTYGRRALESLLAQEVLPDSVRAQYCDAVDTLVGLGEPLFARSEQILVHGDCHRANLLHGRAGWFFLDFDDAGVSAPVQDVWLLLPARIADCPAELEAFLDGYEQFRAFDRASLALVEVLRGLRYIRYADWIARRWDDPAFPRAFPGWGSERYWQDQLNDLYEQIAQLRMREQQAWP